MTSPPGGAATETPRYNNLTYYRGNRDHNNTTTHEDEDDADVDLNGVLLPGSRPSRGF